MYDPVDSEANDERVHFFGTEFICVERLLFPTLPDKSVLKNEILVDTCHGHRGPRESSLQLAQK